MLTSTSYDFIAFMKEKIYSFYEGKKHSRKDRDFSSLFVLIKLFCYTIFMPIHLFVSLIYFLSHLNTCILLQSWKKKLNFTTASVKLLLLAN